MQLKKHSIVLLISGLVAMLASCSRIPYKEVVIPAFKKRHPSAEVGQIYPIGDHGGKTVLGKKTDIVIHFREDDGSMQEIWTVTRKGGDWDARFKCKSESNVCIAEKGQTVLKQDVDPAVKNPDDQGAAAGGKRFESRQFGFVFHVSEKVNIYTNDDPGPMAARITADTPMWIVSSAIPTERINVKITEGATMSDLWQMLDIGSYSELPQYERVSVKQIRIGKNLAKAAYEHIHRLKRNPPKKLRQILFVHKGNAFAFTCSTSVDRYETADREFFDVVFRTMEFK